MTGLARAKLRLVAAAGGLGRWAETLRKSAIGVLYPPQCAHCEGGLESDTTGPLLCHACQAALGPVAWSACPRCGAPTTDGAPPEPNCRLCRGFAFEFDSVVALNAYRSPLRDAVLRAKAPGAEPIVKALGDLLCQRRADLLRALEPDLIVPVPMHWIRRWRRRANTPDLLAATLARFLRVPCRVRLLRKKRNTKPQKGLKVRDRFRNIAGAFAVRTRYDIRGARVLVVDDVLTTGATCTEAARTLKAAGAASVVVAVLARGIGVADA